MKSTMSATEKGVGVEKQEKNNLPEVCSKVRVYFENSRFAEKARGLPGLTEDIPGDFFDHKHNIIKQRNPVKISRIAFNNH